jgi:hypothetical protein
LPKFLGERRDPALAGRLQAAHFVAQRGLARDQVFERALRF